MADDALSRMGLVRRPVFELFGNQGAARNPAFSRDFRMEAAEDMDAEREQRIMDLQDRELRQQEQAQRAVQRYTRQPPNAREQFLEDNPAIALSPQFDDVASYERINAVNRSLAPSMARKLSPAGARRFYENMEKGGMLANDAFEEARDFLDQEDLRVQVYGTGATDEEIKSRFPEGRLTAPEVARFVTERKARLGSDPAVLGMQNYYRLLRDKARMQEDSTGVIDPETEAELATTQDWLANAYKSRMKPPAQTTEAVVETPEGDAVAVTGKPGPVAGPPAGQPSTAPVAKPASYMELLAQGEKASKPDPERDAVNAAWTKAKGSIQDALTDVVPDRVVPGTDINQREAFARAILDNEMVEDQLDPVGEFGASRTPLADVILRRAGLEPYGVALETKGGSFTNQQVLKSWAEEYLNKRGKLLPTKESPTGSKLTPEQEAAFERLQKTIRGNK